MNFPEVVPVELEEVSIVTNTTFDAKVILFNDEIHSFDEVANQIIKAVNCSFDKAMSIANEVHTKGKATVYSGELYQCLKVSSILEEISLHTQIEC